MQLTLELNFFDFTKTNILYFCLEEPFQKLCNSNKFTFFQIKVIYTSILHWNTYYVLTTNLNRNYKNAIKRYTTKQVITIRARRKLCQKFHKSNKCFYVVISVSSFQDVWRYWIYNYKWTGQKLKAVSQTIPVHNAGRSLATDVDRAGVDVLGSRSKTEQEIDERRKIVSCKNILVNA